MDHGEARDSAATSFCLARSMLDRREGGLDGVRRSKMDPMLSREVVEGEHGITIFGEAVGCLRVLGFIQTEESIECFVGFDAGLGLPNLVEMRLGTALDRLWQPVQDIRSLVHPTALLSGFGEDLRERRPEAQGAVTDCHLRRLLEAHVV